MKKFLALLLVFISFTAGAQALTGTLLDAQSHPLSFATVSNVKAQIGNYTDEIHYCLTASR